MHVKYPFDLGSTSRAVTTSSREAQRWFDRGLAWLYAFNHEEAVACFRRALNNDVQCPMAWWGIAYAAGPFYNRPWIRYSNEEIRRELPVCFEAAAQARRRAAAASPVEQALAGAITRRYQAPECTDRATLDTWHREFTAAMREVHTAFPDDLDVLALFAEAAITCTPRRLWDLRTGEMEPSAHTAEIVPLLDAAMRRLHREQRTHAGITHVWIHAIEMSPTPELGLQAADQLRMLVPDCGHLLHMPAHIDVLCGDYAQALHQSRRAVAADDRYVTYGGDRNFYTTARCHDLHMYMYAAMFLGQFDAAMHAADRIAAIVTPGLLDASAPYMRSLLDSHASMRVHVLVRFGRWHDLVAMPARAIDERLQITTAMLAYGRGVALAALGDVEGAAVERQALLAAIDAIPPDTVLLSNSAQEVLGVAEAMLDGELAYRCGQFEVGFDHLRTAVARNDALNYTEPWSWMHPPRHALGALLSEQGRHDEAEAVYRADLGLDDSVARCCQHPDNIWALIGLIECLRVSGDALGERRLRQRLAFARARADAGIASSCFCRGAGMPQAGAGQRRGRASGDMTRSHQHE